MIDVSIVIVCMNNLKNLYPCLESIRKFTSVSYECFVVAYLFTKENLEKVKADFPWVKFVESNEIRGFSENNNLALKQAQGKFCFVVNDDTEMKMPVIDRLVDSIRSLPENVAIVSPVTKFANGKVQFCGRDIVNAKTMILDSLHLGFLCRKSKYRDRRGLFKSYNIIGAAFLIKTDIFHKMGWFNEYYFFAPEDTALSSKLNHQGYECWVNSDIHITHFEGMTGKQRSGNYSLVQTATRPAGDKGLMYFLNGEKIGGLKYYLLCIWRYFITVLRLCYHFIRGVLIPQPNIYIVLAKGDIHILQSLFSKKTPKEIFVNYYSKL